MFRGGGEIESWIQAGETFRLIVTVFDKPIGDLAGVPWREKMHYAGLLWKYCENAAYDLYVAIDAIEERIGSRGTM